MNCHVFRKSLREIAASGGDPKAAAREHLNSCSSCKAAFVEERVLFDLIDATLRAAVNCVIPAGLLQRIRPVSTDRNFRTRKLRKSKKQNIN
jgi:hypothetical protein